METRHFQIKLNIIYTFSWLHIFNCTFVVNHSMWLFLLLPWSYLCALFLSSSKSREVLCVPLFVPVLLIISLPLSVWHLTFPEKSDCNIKFTHKTNLVLSVISIINILNCGRSFLAMWLVLQCDTLFAFLNVSLKDTRFTS